MMCSENVLFFERDNFDLRSFFQTRTRLNIASVPMHIRNVVRTFELSRRMSTVHDFTDLKKLMSKLDTDKVYLFIGNGPKKQYEDMHKVESSVRELLNNLGLRYSFIMRRSIFPKYLITILFSEMVSHG